MKSLKYFFTLLLLVILFWGCNEKSVVEPESMQQIAKRATSLSTEVGTVTPFLSLNAGNSPEGIAIDWLGHIYISNTRDGGAANEIIRVNKNGSWKVYAALPGIGQATGLETDLFGNVYAAFASSDPSTRGVYKIRRNKKPVRLKGSEGMNAPNALIFDFRGNLYATDSDGGTIWKYSKDKNFTKWLDDPLLKGGVNPAGFPIPGVNGIVYFPPNKLYVANTFQNSICRVNIGHDGQASGIQLIKQDFLLMNVDGIAIDIHENIYGVLVASTLGALGAPPVPPVVVLNPKNGELKPLVNDNTYFDTPTSIAFGRGNKNYNYLFVTNAALHYGQPPSAGPGIVKVFVGTLGL